MLDFGREGVPCALLSVAELAAMLGLHTKVVYKKAIEGVFDDVRVNVAGMRLVRFDRQRVLAAIAAGSIGKPQVASTKSTSSLGV